MFAQINDNDICCWQNNLRSGLCDSLTPLAWSVPNGLFRCWMLEQVGQTLAFLRSSLSFVFLGWTSEGWFLGCRWWATSRDTGCVWINLGSLRLSDLWLSSANLFIPLARVVTFATSSMAAQPVSGTSCLRDQRLYIIHVRHVQMGCQHMLNDWLLHTSMRTFEQFRWSSWRRTCWLWEKKKVEGVLALL